VDEDGRESQKKLVVLSKRKNKKHGGLSKNFLFSFIIFDSNSL